jgi:hypothetical protein
LALLVESQFAKAICQRSRHYPLRKGLANTKKWASFKEVTRQCSMTLQEIYTLVDDCRLAALLVMIFLPWVALGICIAVPGDREEPLILNLNLSMAVLSLLMAVGYVWHATHTAGWNKVIRETDILLLLVPFYYVGVSLWVTKQRLPLSEIPVYRVVQGLALLGAGYLGLSWLLSKIHILVLTFMPFQVLIGLILGLIGVAYLGYLRLTGADVSSAEHRGASRSGRQNRSSRNDTGIDDELERLKRKMGK